MKKKESKMFEKAFLEVEEKNLQLTRYFYANNLYEDEVNADDVLKVFKTPKEYRSFYKQQMKAIENRCKKGFSKDEVINEIKSSELYLREFVKNPTRQNIHEKTQEEILKSTIKNINKGNHNYKISYEKNKKNYNYVITDEGIVSESVIRDSYHESKTFDFILNVQKGKKMYRIFFVNKYTKENGGSQDNVCREVETTHKYCTLNTNPFHKFVFVLDGNYWKNKANNIITTKNIIRTTSSKLSMSLLNLINKL